MGYDINCEFRFEGERQMVYEAILSLKKDWNELSTIKTFSSVKITGHNNDFSDYAIVLSKRFPDLKIFLFQFIEYGWSFHEVKDGIRVYEQFFTEWF